MVYRDAKGRFCKKEYAVNAVVKGYKGFHPGLVCQGKEYKENEIVSCESGIHFYKNPLDVFKLYYPINVDCTQNEYAEVEILGEYITGNDIDFSTTKLKIIKKLSLNDLIEIGIRYNLEHNKNVKYEMGYYKVTSKEVVNRVVASICNCSIAATGEFYNAAINTGLNSVAVNIGHYGLASVSGIHSVAIATGRKSKVKGALGCWIACAEFQHNEIIDMQMKKVDGKEIKADTWYMLKNGKFVEVN